ncbi:MAG: hypothetical protein ABIH99_06085, partial [Candidatus Micrarchaeota archaeon]
MDSEVYSILNKNWKSTSRILFGEELGELKDYKNWLLEYTKALRTEKSAVSGNDVSLASTEYCKTAKFERLEEVNFGKKFEPLSLNEMKDIESIIEAVQERVYYTGSIVLGNSKFVEHGTNVSDSFYVYESADIDASEYVAYSSLLKWGKWAFGYSFGGELNCVVKGFNAGRVQRGFEFTQLDKCADIYYGAALEGCNDCMYCFNIKGKRNCIGNLELPKEKYLELKKKI